MRRPYQNIFTKIAAKKNDMTSTENKIADYTLDNLSKISTFTITNLSKEIGVSESSINRFVTKIGFSGYNNFKIEIAQESSYRTDRDAARSDASITQSELLAFDYNELINIISKNIDEKLLLNISKDIENAKNIYIVAFSEAQVVAYHFQYQLLLLGIQTSVINDLTTLEILTNNNNTDNLFFTISEQGNKKSLNNLLEVNKQNFGKNYIFTSYSQSKLAELADKYILIPNKLSINQKSMISSYIAYIYVVDLLMVTLIKSDKKHIKQKLQNEGITSKTDYETYEY